MARKNIKYIAFANIMLCLACNNIEKKNNDTDIAKKDSTEVISSPNVLTNYWQNFNFSDSTSYSPETSEQIFANFINAFPNYDNKQVSAAIDGLIENSESSDFAFQYFLNLFDKYLYDGNSPFHNDLYYEMALNKLVKSQRISDTDKIKYTTIKKLVSKNQMGTKATNFTFSTDKKSTQQLYELQGAFTILFFYEPNCPVCKSHIETLKKDTHFNEYLTENNINLLAVYPDGNLEIWDNFKNELPQNWINAIDKNQTILKNQLYDLKASPTIYLLDKDMNVILKDCSLEHVYQFFSGQ